MKTICITLPETPERTEAAKAHFLKRGIDAMFFPGIHGETSGLITTHPHQADNHNGLRIRSKCVGVFVSHYMVWSAMTLFEKEKHFMILEDDARFPKNWKNGLVNAMAIAKDFDILLLKNSIKGWPIHIAYVLSREGLGMLLRSQRHISAALSWSLLENSFIHMKVHIVKNDLVRRADAIK